MSDVVDNDVLPAHVEQIVDQLEEFIVFGRLHPRERLVEVALAAQFGVNRHTIRQALIRLEALGLIERKRNKGAVVREFTVEDAVHIYAVREMLEVAAASEMLLPAAPSLLDRLVAIQEEHDVSVHSGDLRALFRSNAEFHRALFSGCKNPFLFEAVDHFASRSHAIRSFSMTNPDYLHAARAEHWDMIEALRTSDRDRLVDLCRSHLVRSRERYIEEYTNRYAGWRAASPQKENRRDR